MVSADELTKSISPGSIPYGERGAVEDRMAQVVAQGQSPAQATPGAASRGGLEKLGKGPVSDMPVTSGLSVGPGPGNNPDPMAGMPGVDQLRIIAQYSRSPRLRMLARDALRAKVLGH